MINFPRKTIAIKVITTFLSLILKLKNFVFNCKNYIQMKGSFMGTIDHFERKYISIYSITNLSIRCILYMDKK